MMGITKLEGVMHETLDSLQRAADLHWAWSAQCDHMSSDTSGSLIFSFCHSCALVGLLCHYLALSSGVLRNF